MVSITKRNIRGNEYYSLQYSYRVDGVGKNLYKEIGKEIPPNIEEIKEEFIREIVKKRWIQVIDQRNEDYLSKLDKLPEFLKIEHLKEFGIRFTYHSNKIEGSTLTLREVALIVNEPNVPINKSSYDIIEARLHMEIYENIIKSKLTSKLSMDLIKNWHRSLFSLHINRVNLCPGEIRKDQIYISGSKYVPPAGGIACEMLLDDLFKWYDENKDKMHLVLLACLMHFEFVSIHPFNDGNGRMSRLVMNYILFQNNYPMFDFSDKIRKTYYNALEKGNLKEDKMLFVGWFFRNYMKYIKNLNI